MLLRSPLERKQKPLSSWCKNIHILPMALQDEHLNTAHGMAYALPFLMRLSLSSEFCQLPGFVSTSRCCGLGSSGGLVRMKGHGRSCSCVGWKATSSGTALDSFGEGREAAEIRTRAGREPKAYTCSVGQNTLHTALTCNNGIVIASFLGRVCPGCISAPPTF